MILDTIYKKSKTGAIVYCKIETINDQIIVETGQVGTTSPISHVTTCKPKNTGKTNTTTGSEQAKLEALAKHAKKIKSGYVLDKSGETNVRLPMKVKSIQDQWKNVIYPCISTPKLNGVNGTYRLENGKLNLYSRGGDIRPEIPHLTPRIISIMSSLKVNEINVELYKHGEHLQDLSSAVTKTNNLSSKLEAHIFDIVTKDDYEARRNAMLYWQARSYPDMINFLIGIICNNQQDIEKHYEECIVKGFEGTVIKNYNGLYQHNIRSSDQFKYKKALDAEYQTIGYNIDKHGHPVWECVCNITPQELEDQHRELTASQGKKLIKLHTFNVKMKGTASERLTMAAIADTLVGQWMKIEYETLSKDNKPLKPVGIAWRKCDIDGNPIE